MDSIPVVDIAPFAEGGAKDREAVARQVDSACSSLGFLIISGHGVADRLIDDMRKVSLAYFDQAPFAFNGKIITTKISYPKKDKEHSLSASPDEGQ